MIFPKPISVQSNGCIAILAYRATKDFLRGKPMTSGRREVSFEGEVWSSYRLSYHLNVKSITRRPPSRKDGFVLHKCDNEWCINPEHLYLGSQSQNIRDILDRNENLKPHLKAAAKIRWSDPEKRMKVSEQMKGNKYAEGSTGNRGKKRSPEIRLKLSTSQKNRKKSK